MLIMLAMRLESAKNALIAPISQMSSSLNPWLRSSAKSASLTSADLSATLKEKSSMAFCRGVMSALR
ncbi:hypothetical protein D3C83_240760 [compost metagenome]